MDSGASSRATRRRATRGWDGRSAFVDTGGWLSVLDPRDQYHTSGREMYGRLLRGDATLVTTNLVIAETYTLLRRAAGSRRALRFLDILQQSPRIETIFSSASVEADGYAMLRQYEDQTFSYVDAVSFAVMRRQGLQVAFAFDRHFLVAGFELIS